MKKKENETELSPEDISLLNIYDKQREEKENAREWFNDCVEQRDVQDTLENFKEGY